VRAFDFAASQPWVIREESLTVILDIAQRDHVADFEAVAAKQARAVDQGGLMSMRGSTAVINITGPIFRHANLFTEISGATSIESLALAFEKARSNPAVRAILLNIDSPGGEVSGTGEFAAQIKAARGEKKIIAYAGDQMASGAYWLASSAEEIVLFDTASAGSIGVVATYGVRAPQDGSRGVKEYQFVSSRAPKKRPDLSSDDGRAVIQAGVDDLEAEMVRAIASNRGVTAEKVTADFGQGGMMIASKAIAAGMADRVGSFEGVLAELEEAATSTYSFGGSAVNYPHTGAVSMSEPTAENPTAPAIPVVDTAAVRAEAVATERTRIRAIVSCEEAVGREPLAQMLALETQSTLEESRKLLAASPKNESKTKNNAFAAHMEKVANPTVGQDPAGGADGSDVSVASTIALFQGKKG
jgi:ClpP class serine protease